MPKKSKRGKPSQFQPQSFPCVGLLCKHLWAFTVALFIVSFIVRLLMIFRNGPMVIDTYPDELRYFQIARSIAEQGEILIRDTPTMFQKILYPLFLSPAFLLTENSLLQTQIISVINCLLMSSTVFPVMLLARKITSNNAVVIISLFVTVTLPDMVYSATFMSEVLYMPLVIWLFYLTCLAFTAQRESKRLILFAIYGFVVYLVYLTKEIGAAFLISAALLLAIDGIRDNRRIKRNGLAVMAFLLTFFAAFFVMKLTLFHGMGNTYGAVSGYNQISLTVFSSANVYFYLGYSALILFLAAMMSFYVLPILIPLYDYGSMSEKNRTIYLFAIFTLVIMIGIIAYTISIREDLGELVPRLHLRYVAPLVVPLLILCFDSLLSIKPAKLGKRFLSAFLIIVALFCVATAFLLPCEPMTDYFSDHFSLRSMVPLLDYYEVSGEVLINWTWMLFKILLLLLTVFGITFLIKANRQLILIILIFSTLTINAYDNFWSYSYASFTNNAVVIEVFGELENNHDYYNYDYLDIIFYPESLQLSNRFVEALNSVNSYVKQLDGTVAVIGPPQLAYHADTYLNPHVFSVDIDQLWYLSAFNNGCIELDAQPINDMYPANSGSISIITNSWERNILQFDYIIALEYDNPFENVEVIYTQTPFVVLRNLDPAKLCMIQDY